MPHTINNEKKFTTRDANEFTTRDEDITVAHVVGKHLGSFTQGFVRGTSTTLKLLAGAAEVLENTIILGVKYTHKKATQHSEKPQFEITKGFSEGFKESELWSEALETTVNNKIKNMSINDITL